METAIKIRKCYKCHEEKEVNQDNFHRSKNRPLGFEYKCKTCENKRTKSHCKNWANYTDEQKQNKYKNQKKHSARYNILFKHLHIKGAYKTIDRIKNRENDLTIDYVKESIGKPCIYCGFPSTGLDRMDNKIGHLISNCVPCCLECNHARNDNFSVDEMLIIGKTIREIKLTRINNDKDFIDGTHFLNI